MTKRDFNQEAKPLADKKYNYNFDAIVRDYMMRAFAPFFQPGPALELGCYEGDSTLELEKAFDDLTVVEASSDALAVARRRVGAKVRFIESTIEDLDPGTQYETIFLINTLEHIEDAVAALTRIRGWLSPTGRLFVLVPNADAPSRQIAVFMGLVESNNAVTPGERVHGHHRTYSFDTLNADLRRAGLSVMQAGGILFKGMANFQMDKALDAGIIDMDYIDGCYRLGQLHPTLCSSIFAVCTR